MARAAAAPRGPARRRTTPQTRRGGGIHWERVGRIALLGVLGIIVLLYVPPVTHWFQQRNTAQRSQEQLTELQAERARLRARLRELSGPGAVEREARKLGMTRRDERPYVVTP
ncbi:MAG TPA: septum formation initiator family protein [Thermoleophilaceae bacterium]|jgi:cell division protein FtsB